MSSSSPIKANENKSLTGHYAGFTSRLIAFSIDISIVSIVIIFFTWFVSATLEMLQVKLLLTALNKSSSGLNPVISFLFSPIIASILSVIFIFGYHVLFWFFTGQTPGKMILGIRVVPLRGGKMSIWRAFLRYLCYPISAIPLGLGFISILIDDQRMGWHDKLARTCVIYIWDARPDETFLLGSR